MKRYFITDRRAVGGFKPLLEVIRDQIRLGVDLIQIREKDVGARELFDFTLAAVKARQADVQAHGRTKILVNTRADVALAAGADGVHLPSNAPRETLSGLLLSRACHTLAEVRESSADLITFGPVFASPGKGTPVGLEALRAACSLGKRVYALGGVNWDNAAACMDAGAEGIAGIRLFQAPDL
jgi:thiamine-phosphate pyrophosphorylase